MPIEPEIPFRYSDKNFKWVGYIFTILVIHRLQEQCVRVCM